MLSIYGWNEQWQMTWEANTNPTIHAKVRPARVIAQFSHTYKIATEAGERLANVTGKFETQGRHKKRFSCRRRLGIRRASR